jgi:hypothetical protein
VSIDKAPGRLRHTLRIVKITAVRQIRLGRDGGEKSAELRFGRTKEAVSAKKKLEGLLPSFLDRRSQRSPSQQFFHCLGIAVVNKHQHNHGVYFSAPIHPGAWRESHIDDWMKARKAKGDLSWMRFSLKE